MFCIQLVRLLGESTPDIVDVAGNNVEAVFLDPETMEELEKVDMKTMTLQEMKKVFTDHGFTFDLNKPQKQMVLSFYESNLLMRRLNQRRRRRRRRTIFQSKVNYKTGNTLFL